MEIAKYSTKLKFWISWLAITVIHILLFLTKQNLSLPFRIINVFTPYGFWTTLYSLHNPFGWLGIVLFVFVILKIDKVALLLEIRGALSKIFFNLIILAIFTCIVDFYLFNDIVSIKTLFDVNYRIDENYLSF